VTERNEQKLEWLQALRGIAAMMVLFYHLWPHWDKQAFLAHAVPAMKFGFSGVDVFFVLSGFVVTMTAENLLGRDEALRFLIRRAIRIYFGYWPALLTTVLVFGLLFGAHYQADQRAISSLLLLSFWPDDHWLGTAWSLTFELYFYVGITLLVSFCKPSIRPRVLAIAFLLVALWNAALMFSSKPAFIGGVQPLRMWLSAYILEFIAGALFAYYRQHLKWHPVLAMVALSLVVTGAAVGSFSEWFDRIELLRVGTFGLAAAALVFLTLMVQANNAFRAPRWLVAVGDASYSLYLLHPALVALLYGRLDYFHPTNGTGRLLLEMLIPILCIALTYAWYRLIEHPLYRWGTRTLLPKAPLLESRVSHKPVN
jgi:exopolysaccharide production protein ExoZ